MKKKNLNEVLSSGIIDILEENGVSYDLCEDRGNEYCAELEWRTDLDGDQVWAIWFDKDEADSSFANSLRGYFHDFDVDEYVEMWLQAKHDRPDICPLNARQLVQDGEEIEDFLDELSRKVWLAA